MNLLELMPHTVTYWLPSSNNETGGREYGPPVVVPCRWQDVAELFMSREGVQATSTSVVYTAVVIPLEAMIARGDHSTVVDPFTVSSFEIRSAQSSSSLDGGSVLYKGVV